MTAELRCSQCGGPLSLMEGQSLVMPTVTLTRDAEDPGAFMVESVADDAWCGPCLMGWDQRMGFVGAGPVQ